MLLLAVRYLTEGGVSVNLCVNHGSGKMNNKNILVLLLILIGRVLSISNEYPSVKGTFRMNTVWSVDLPAEFNGRFEAGDLVIWKPGLTLWIEAKGRERGELKYERYKRFKKENSKNKRNERIEEDVRQTLDTYEFKVRDETREIKEYFAIYAFKINEFSFVQIWAYADSGKDKIMAYSIIRSIKIDTSVVTSYDLLKMNNLQSRHDVPPYLRRIQPNMLR
jgi:hypothetical protein